MTIRTPAIDRLAVSRAWKAANENPSLTNCIVCKYSLCGTHGYGAPNTLKCLNTHEKDNGSQYCPENMMEQTGCTAYSKVSRLQMVGRQIDALMPYLR